MKAPKPHKWIPSQLGHGDLQCETCKITSAEAVVLGLLDDCGGKFELKKVSTRSLKSEVRK